MSRTAKRISTNLQLYLETSDQELLANTLRSMRKAGIIDRNLRPFLDAEYPADVMLPRVRQILPLVEMY